MIVDFLKKFLKKSLLEDLDYVENFSEVNLVYKLKTIDLDYDCLKQFLSSLPNKEQWVFSVKVPGITDDFPSISKNTSDSPDFESEYLSFVKNIKQFFKDNHEEGFFELKIDIYKCQNTLGTIKEIYIYNLDGFLKAIINKNLIEVLDLFVSLDLSKNQMHLICLDQLDAFIFSPIISIDSSRNKNETLIDKSKQQELLKTANKIKENSHFIQASNYPFCPGHFYLENTNGAMTPEQVKFTHILKQLTLIFSLFSIFDYSEIIFDVNNKSDSYIKLKLSGYKHSEITLLFNDLDKYIKNYEEYFKIYEWSYLGDGPVIDKLGIVRNILSLHLNNDISISQSTWNSILSAHKIYLKENINKYLDLRSKIHESLDSISKKATENIDKYIDDFKKSTYAFATFFTTVFLIRAISGQKIEGAFNFETTLVAFGLLIVALICLVFSWWLTTQNIGRMALDYENLKQRYNDVLDEADISTILKNDSEFTAQKKYANSKKNQITAFWFLTLFIFLLIVLSTSSLVNWALLKNFFNILGFAGKCFLLLCHLGA